MGILFLILMFIVPAFIALNGMFGSNLSAVLNGRTEDRVKYTKPGDPAAPKTDPTPAADSKAPSGTGAAKRSSKTTKAEANPESSTADSA